jgi:hypothetical protein
MTSYSLSKINPTRLPYLADKKLCKNVILITKAIYTFHFYRSDIDFKIFIIDFFISLSYFENKKIILPGGK